MKLLFFLFFQLLLTLTSSHTLKFKQPLEIMEKIYYTFGNYTELHWRIHLYLSSTVRNDGFNDAVINIDINQKEDCVDISIISKCSEIKAYEVEIPHMWAIDYAGYIIFQDLVHLGLTGTDWVYSTPSGFGLLKRDYLILMHYPPRYVWETGGGFSGGTMERLGNTIQTAGGDIFRETAVCDFLPIGTDPNKKPNFTSPVYHHFYPLFLERLLHLSHGGKLPLYILGEPAREFFFGCPAPSVDDLESIVHNINYQPRGNWDLKPISFKATFANHPSYYYRGNLTDEEKKHVAFVDQKSFNATYNIKLNNKFTCTFSKTNMTSLISIYVIISVCGVIILFFIRWYIVRPIQRKKSDDETYISLTEKADDYQPESGI